MDVAADMMTDHVCGKCGKKFGDRIALGLHLDRKTPCGTAVRCSGRTRDGGPCLMIRRFHRSIDAAGPGPLCRHHRGPVRPLPEILAEVEAAKAVRNWGMVLKWSDAEAARAHWRALAVVYGFELDGGDTPLYAAGAGEEETLVSIRYHRIVVSEFGAYAEINPGDFNLTDVTWVDDDARVRSAKAKYRALVTGGGTPATFQLLPAPGPGFVPNHFYVNVADIAPVHG